MQCSTDHLPRHSHLQLKYSTTHCYLRYSLLGKWSVTIRDIAKRFEILLDDDDIADLVASIWDYPSISDVVDIYTDHDFSGYLPIIQIIVRFAIV